MMKRTHMCGELRQNHNGQSVVLAGWVNTFRSQGKGLLFIDLRDRDGMTQLIFDLEDADEEIVQLANGLRREDVIAVRGEVRAKDKPNPKLSTGEIEVLVSELEILNKTEKPPILPEDHEAEQVAEDVRLKHRYIDLRRPRMQHMLRTRHQVAMSAREYFGTEGFLEIETPCLIKSTPEGARDYIVPSRIYPGNWYALPQSPQIFKQILMVAGCDRYMQIVRCFRDEDPRADRQAEFTQIDLEMSFVERADVMEVVSDFVRQLWRNVVDVQIGDIPTMTYKDAMERYGIDRPDLRFGLELSDVSDLAGKTDFRVFTEALEEDNGVVKAIRVPGGAKQLTRKVIDKYNEFVKTFKAGGLPSVKLTENGFETGIAKFVAPIGDALKEQLSLEVGDLVFFAADTWSIVTKALGELRNQLGRDLELIDEDAWNFLWIVDFPMFEYDDEAGRWVALHHPFTSPMPDQFDILESDPGACISAGYDLVCNGSEIAGGSIRIHDRKVQQRVFELLGISEEEAEQKFGFLLKALRYGAPPHGGIAFGLERIIMQMIGRDNIRDVIAFPKTLNGADLMSEAPGPVDEAQLEELCVQVTLPSN